MRTWLASGGNGPVFPASCPPVMVGSLPLAMRDALRTQGDEQRRRFCQEPDKRRTAGRDCRNCSHFVSASGDEALDNGLKSGRWDSALAPCRPPQVVDRQVRSEPFEAAHTILDLYLQGGLVAVVALAWIVGSAACPPGGRNSTPCWRWSRRSADFRHATPDHPPPDRVVCADHLPCCRNSPCSSATSRIF